jgi:predicted nucleotidyltransferase
VSQHAELLLTLHRHGVEFVVVGDLAAVIQGAPVHTLDVDVVYARTPENIERLLVVLKELDARFRTDPRELCPDASHLRSTGHKLLKTKLGVLDLLGTIEEATGYDDLLGDTEIVHIGAVPVRVLTLERLIRVKETLSRPKDRLMLTILRATLEERQKK